MRTYVLIPGGGAGPGYWSRLVPLLDGEVIALDLPTADPAAGVPEYADIAVEAVGDRQDVVVVAHSLGGLTAPLVAARVRARAIVLITAIVTKPGESGLEWWEATGHSALGIDSSDERAVFYNGVDPEGIAIGDAATRDQSFTPFEAVGQPWPNVHVRFLFCTEDRFFPIDFMRRVVDERLPHAETADVPAGHMPMLSHPKEVADFINQT
ncbi:alpha/beta hydrolase [Herbidospora galbida]|uniref:Alpha/beta hydrolase n=1 Tax=Herbidospora galbida TaxID=2575442 RepID=A0A4U3MLP8_9ACTN|nr:alpha/beta hydrolase [Herbidospora galbida]TKK89484.1 alpha/beta hydrolase [Herbidospora galbida]